MILPLLVSADTVSVSLFVLCSKQVKALLPNVVIYDKLLRNLSHFSSQLEA